MIQYSLNKLIQIRKSIHSLPQIGFNQFQTHKKIINFLTQIGIQTKNCKFYAKTGITLDIYGKGQPKGKPRIVAFRADIDALSIRQNNEDLQHKSTNQNGHMCGHDGHITCLLAFAWKFNLNKQKFPSNRAIRLLFQPSQQGPQSGALQMIKQGCLKQVDQIYGYHNWPTAIAGQLWVKKGPVMSQSTIIKIKIIGDGGHGSQPQKVKHSLRPAIKFIQQSDKITDKYMKEGKHFVMTFPVLKAGDRYNVFNPCSYIQGTLRSFEEGLNIQIKKDIQNVLMSFQKEGFQCDLFFNTIFPVNQNTQKEALHVKRIAQKSKLFKIVSQGKLPFRASQDFSFYTKQIPGAFFFASSQKKQSDPMLHSNTFDFNDDIIQSVSGLYYELSLDRLNED